MTVTIVVILVAGLLVWIGATLIIDAWLGRPKRLGLAERLRPFQPRSVGDEAESWLNQQR